MVQTNFRNRKLLFLCECVCVCVCSKAYACAGVCVSVLQCVAAEGTQKEDDGCETNMLLQKPEVCLLPIFSTITLK